MRRIAIAVVLVALVAVVPALGVFGVPPAFAATHAHKNLQEALEHLEKHTHDMLEALKAGYKVDPKAEKGIMKDTEHVEEMLDKELEKAKKMKK
jgi:hypothetical protein